MKGRPVRDEIEKWPDISAAVLVQDIPVFVQKEQAEMQVMPVI